MSISVLSEEVWGMHSKVGAPAWRVMPQSLWGFCPSGVLMVQSLVLELQAQTSDSAGDSELKKTLAILVHINQTHIILSYVQQNAIMVIIIMTKETRYSKPLPIFLSAKYRVTWWKWIRTRWTSYNIQLFNDLNG